MKRVRFFLATATAILAASCNCQIAEDPEEMYSKIYEIPPAFIPDDELDAKTDSDDPFARPESPGKPKSASEILADEGVTFPEGSMLFHGLPVSGIGMRNTWTNHELLHKYLDREFPGEWRIYEQTNAD